MKKILLSISLVSSQVIFSQIYTPGGAVNTTESPATGNVGIGTVNPLQKFTIDAPNGEPNKSGILQNGIFRLQTAQSKNWGEVLDFGMHIGIQGPPSYAWIQATNKDNLSINYNLNLNPLGGNVGIGTTNPQAKLDINGNILLRNYTNVGGAGAQINFSSYSESSPGPRIRSHLEFAEGTNSRSSLILGSYWEGYKDELILRNGNVGIGYSNPQSKLTIYDAGDIGSSQLELRSNHLRNPTRYFMKNVIAGTGSDDITFSLKHDGEMFVSGNVGIGTTNPQAKLDIDFGGEPKSIKFLETPNAINTMNAMMRFIWYNNTADFGLIRSVDSNIEALGFRFNGEEKARITPSGNASFQGKLEAKEVKVTTTPTADFVFEKDYQLPTLEEVEKHIKENKHLPEIASAKQMEKEGVNVGEFQIKLLQKIEELTLYSIEQNKLLKIQSEKIELLQKELNTLKSKK